MTLQKWKLISKKDVSPSKWLPVEERVYELPNGKIVDDFTVVTLADVAMVVPITTDKKVVLVKQYKPGINDIVLQFPAGRLESIHADIDELALHELEEEVGIKAKKNQLTQFAKLSGFSTKASEIVFAYLATECEFNSTQNLDPNEEIEILTVSFEEMDDLVESGQIWCSQTIAAWILAKMKLPSLITGISARNEGE